MRFPIPAEPIHQRLEVRGRAHGHHREKAGVPGHTVRLYNLGYGLHRLGDLGHLPPGTVKAHDGGEGKAQGTEVNLRLIAGDDPRIFELADALDHAGDRQSYLLSQLAVGDAGIGLQRL